MLGVKIIRDHFRRHLNLSQETYTKKVLERFQMQTCKLVDTPVEKGSILSLSMCPQTSKKKDKMARGSLMYAMMCSWSDICYAVGLISRFPVNHGLAQWKAMKWIFRCLKRIADNMLYHQAPNLRLVG